MLSCISIRLRLLISLLGGQRCKHRYGRRKRLLLLLHWRRVRSLHDLLDGLLYMLLRVLLLDMRLRRGWLWLRLRLLLLLLDGRLDRWWAGHDLVGGGSRG